MAIKHLSLNKHFGNRVFQTRLTKIAKPIDLYTDKRILFYMSLFKNPFKGPDELWQCNKDGIKIEYPIFCYDPMIPHDPIIKLTIKEVCGDVDFWGWQWGEQERIIDSSGKVFYTKYEMSGQWRSGVFPDNVEREVDIKAVENIMKHAVETHGFHIENKNEILASIDNCNTIKEILEKCGKYF